MSFKSRFKMAQPDWMAGVGFVFFSAGNCIGADRYDESSFHGKKTGGIGENARRVSRCGFAFFLDDAFLDTPEIEFRCQFA